MILRNFGIRHGRKAFAGQVSRSCLRALSTESSSTTTANPTELNSLPAESGPKTNAYSSSPFYNPAIPPRLPSGAAMEQDPIVENYKAMQHLQRTTKTIGAEVERRYTPGEILKNPPSDASLELLMASQAHMGHNKSLWNPANSRFIWGERAGIHIISLEVTQTHLRRAARVVEEVAFRGGLILFVGTRKGQTDAVVTAAELAGACHLFTKWTPGTITNKDQILAGEELQIVDQFDRPVEGFETHLRDRRPVEPDLVVCLNPLENYTMLYECGLANIPTIGIIDTNADPTWVTYTIPANDDSIRCVSVIASVLGRAGQRGQARRMEAAEKGVVTWQNPRDIDKFMAVDARIKAAERKKELEATGEAGAQRQENDML